MFVKFDFHKVKLWRLGEKERNKTRQSERYHPGQSPPILPSPNQHSLDFPLETKPERFGQEGCCYGAGRKFLWCWFAQ